MAKRPVVILHGWSDSGASFERLAGHIAAQLPSVEVSLISIGEYLSMNDELRFDDLQAAMDAAWADRGLPRGRGSVDAIVHSTGAPVMREWLSRRFAPEDTPVRRLVMLAPANFGSPLAHKGRSFLGRASKGFFGRQEGQSLFNTGTQILKGLELASPFSWDLALRDRFPAGNGAYARRRTLCTVLVGNTGYSGIRAIANEDGSDGTVRISTANMNCAYLGIRIEARRDGSGQVCCVPRIASRKSSAGRTAFRIMDGIDHSSIKLDAPRSRLGKAQEEVLTMIVQALMVNDQGFDTFCDSCDRATAALTQASRRTPPLQTTVAHVHDQFGVPVTDYLLEFYDPRRKDGGSAARAVHEQAIRKVHAYGDDASYRALYIDSDRLLRAAAEADGRLGFSITATPVLDDRRLVGFATLSDDDIEDLLLPADEVEALFQPHCTLLLDIELPRLQKAEVFRMRGI